ncbi:hypothetical protein TcYC6_0126840 [Trypanosoma cruzi]|uniref:Uncharacterized protein n=1 Tax=Trypanosoma cruzi (strain CL Brener) TaxID=353153 RepID=Q4CLW9_TRYCC|nr:hypothetical protein Tc00.1047053505683.5 [Trypanosoma cruzi]EAN81271.1 hypothetical protein Tc00.1047053505683.5 [Trypanosoma cruzi]KAF8291274.1 hypothetical protein TcYC6_0126880 [Trypanosoma cruzi]KAF8291391.1 hypothetical protein TcYC6_0126860 [Trypanosoma cruzi]KAF8291416.1 hypothetical protein TcYC6_0126840 [Trypanosoma cruzi]|eukprot:XP_802717.1 hypothetical protein [Trypanosoma cruzi strain CL Brener]
MEVRGKGNRTLQPAGIGLCIHVYICNSSVHEDVIVMGTARRRKWFLDSCRHHHHRSTFLLSHLLFFVLFFCLCLLFREMTLQLFLADTSLCVLCVRENIPVWPFALLLSGPQRGPSRIFFFSSTRPAPLLPCLHDELFETGDLWLMTGAP